MKKILFVAHDTGYFLLHRLPVALAAREAGYEVEVASPVERSDEVRALRFPWYPIRLVRSSRNPFVELTTLFDALRAYRKSRPDLVHQVTIKPVLYGTVAARLAGVPAVLNVITGLGHLFIDDSLSSRFLRVIVGGMYRVALRHRNMTVAFENGDDERFFLSRGWVDREQTRIVLSGVDIHSFSPPAPAPPHPPVVLFAGRMLYSKGITDLIEAWRTLKAEGLEARLVFVGEPDMQNPSAVPVAQLEQWQSEGLIEYFGRRPACEIPEIMRQSDLFVLPSAYREGLPRVLLEAAACGLPVITTDVFGCRDAVANGETGLIVPTRDPVALAAAIRRLLLDPELRARMGYAGRKRVENEFSMEEANAAMLGVYEQLLARAEGHQLQSVTSLAP